MKKVICFFVCVLICIGFSVKAQVTTSVLGGKIIDDQNEYVIGATVVAVHEPSGTMYGAVTNVDGRYTIQGMRTGGPYKVEISYVGYKRLFYGYQVGIGQYICPECDLVSQFGAIGRSGSHC